MQKAQQNKKKLFLFHTEFLHLRGGEKFVYEITKRLVGSHTITLCVEKISPHWNRRFAKLHVSVYRLWRPPFLYWLLLPFSFFINALRLKHFISPQDVVFATSFPLSLLSTVVSKKTIVFCFEPLSIFYDVLRIKMGSLREKLFLPIIKVLYEPFDRLAVQRSWLLATLNEPVASAMAFRYNKKPNFFIPNGVDTKFFCPSAQPLLNVGSKYDLVIGHSTDYTVLKGTEVVLRALPFVIKKQPRTLLLISESIPNKKARLRYENLILSLKIHHHVRFVGCVSEKRLPGFYTACSVFCYCGSTRCVGGSSASLSVIESEACGTPVLRSGGNTDEICSGKTGFYFPTESPTAVARTILRYASLSKKTILSMKTNARKYVTTNFSWDSAAQKLQAIL